MMGGSQKKEEEEEEEAKKKKRKTTFRERNTESFTERQKRSGWLADTDATDHMHHLSIIRL
jgi:hypothetical protein